MIRGASYNISRHVNICMCAYVCMQRFATFILIVLVILHLNQNKFTFQEIAAPTFNGGMPR